MYNGNNGVGVIKEQKWWSFDTGQRVLYIMEKIALLFQTTMRGVLRGRGIAGWKDIAKKLGNLFVANSKCLVGHRSRLAFGWAIPKKRSL